MSTTDPSANLSEALATVTGPIVMIGFGSIGRGTLPLLERHIGFDKAQFTVIAPDDEDRAVLAAPGYVMLNGAKLTRDQLSAAGIAATDISASNGIVHVINRVLLP